MKRTYGAQSNVGTLKKALIHRPGFEFANPKVFIPYYEGEMPVPDLTKAQAEHDGFAKALTDYGVEIEYLGDVAPDKISSIYATDMALILDDGAIISRPGKEERLGEELVTENKLKEMGIPIIGRITAPATFEGGGETIWLDHDTLLVGSTYRTNDEGFWQLKELLKGKVECIQFQMSYYKGPKKCLHLGSCISMIDKDLCVGYLPLMPIPMVKLLTERGVKILPVPEEEFLRSAVNILAVAPRKVVMISGNPTTKKLLEDHGVTVKEFDAELCCSTRYAGPTCLTMSILRDYDERGYGK